MLLQEVWDDYSFFREPQKRLSEQSIQYSSIRQLESGSWRIRYMGACFLCTAAFFLCRRRRRSGIQTLKRQLHNKSSFLIFAVSFSSQILLNPYDCKSWTLTGGGGRWSRSPVSPLVFPFGKQFKLTLRSFECVSSHLTISSSHSLPHLFAASRWPILSLLISHSPISSFSSFKSVSVSHLFLALLLRFPDEVLQV